MRWESLRDEIKKASISHLPLRVDVLFSKTLKCSPQMLELDLVDTHIQANECLDISK